MKIFIGILILFVGISLLQAAEILKKKKQECKKVTEACAKHEECCDNKEMKGGCVDGTCKRHASQRDSNCKSDEECISGKCFIPDYFLCSYNKNGQYCQKRQHCGSYNCDQATMMCKKSE